MTHARWDLIFRALEGPLARQGDILRRGPVVTLGANPGPGGLKLNDYRALEDRHAVVSVAGGGEVSITPTGNSPVRVAPYCVQDWAEIEPLRGPVALSEGSAFHLGPVNRGVTLELVACQPLDAWAGARIQSGISAHESHELRANRKVPSWFIGGIVFLGVALSAAITLRVLREDPVAPLGPIDEGLELYAAVTPDVVLNPALKGGFDQAFDRFVLAPSADAAGDPALRTDRRRWDEALLDFAARSAQQHMQARRFWARLERVVEDYAYVVGALREAGLPEVFAAIPYQESGYRADAQSAVCAKGYWQLMPEVARRVGVTVSGCTLTGRMENWSPDQLSPPRGVIRNAAYVRDGQCIIPPLRGCAVDERTSLASATRGALIALSEAWQDETLRASGAAVALTIASHNAGYDDGRYDNPKSTNVLPAYRAWLSAAQLEADPKFIGAQIRCATGESKGCEPILLQETQHYVYPILAQHFLAVCYYATNYGDRDVFRPWRELVTGDGYCTRLTIPTSEESKKWM